MKMNNTVFLIRVMIGVVQAGVVFGMSSGVSSGIVLDEVPRRVVSPYISVRSSQREIYDEKRLLDENERDAVATLIDPLCVPLEDALVMGKKVGNKDYFYPVIESELVAAFSEEVAVAFYQKIASGLHDLYMCNPAPNDLEWNKRLDGAWKEVIHKLVALRISTPGKHACAPAGASFKGILHRLCGGCDEVQLR